jgi:hypothetical protein
MPVIFEYVPFTLLIAEMVALVNKPAVGPGMRRPRSSGGFALNDPVPVGGDGFQDEEGGGRADGTRVARVGVLTEERMPNMAHVALEQAMSDARFSSILCQLPQ